MQTALLTDVLDKAIHAGDLVLDDSGNLYFVDDTENSFLRQGYLRVRLARISRGHYVSAENHSYTPANFTLALDKVALEELPVDKAERRRFFRDKAEYSTRRKIDRYLLRSRNGKD